MYIKPSNVISPKTTVSDVQPILDYGENEVSMALIKWDGEPNVAVRWNGGESEGRINPGTPQSHAIPTWWVVPEYWHAYFLEFALKELESGSGIIDIDLEGSKKAVIDAMASWANPASNPSKPDDYLGKRLREMLLSMRATGEI